MVEKSFLKFSSGMLTNSRHVRSVANNTISTQKQCKDFNLHWMCLYIVNIRLSDRQKKF